MQKITVLDVAEQIFYEIGNATKPQEIRAIEARLDSAKSTIHADDFNILKRNINEAYCRLNDGVPVNHKARHLIS
jgi:hypothetical protein